MQHRVQVDRIEGDRAILVGGPEGRETLTLPAAWLPEGVREGMALDVQLTVASTDQTKAEVQDLLDELFGTTGT